MSELTVTALAPWFGSNRMLAHEVGVALSGCKWVGVVFAGSLCEVPHIKARTINVNDKHKHIINLAMVAADGTLGPKLYRGLRRLPFSDCVLKASQDRCRAREAIEWSGQPDLDWAADYFCAVWMSRSHIAGSFDEFHGKTSKRWNANGGDSNKRYRSAVASLPAWRRVLQACNFTHDDCFDFLARCEDSPTTGVYCDPPFPGPGDQYKHKFSEADHRKLADWLGRFEYTRVVCRFYDHPLIRELYDENEWHWRRLEGGRKQTNEKAPEVLITNQSRDLFQEQQ